MTKSAVEEVNLYAERDPEELEPWFSRHMNAMTVEGLHSKAAIAEELAFRDKELDRLRAEREGKVLVPRELLRKLAYAENVSEAITQMESLLAAAEEESRRG